MTALWALVIVVLILLISSSALIALVIFKAVPGAFRALDHQQARHERHMDKLLDRLMTVRWEDYIATQDLQVAEEGGFYGPGEQDEETVKIEEPGGRWGHLSALRDHQEREEHEESLLAEDFGGKA